MRKASPRPPAAPLYLIPQLNAVEANPSPAYSREKPVPVGLPLEADPPRQDQPLPAEPGPLFSMQVRPPEVRKATLVD